jgi:ubiquitin-like 1-activating enzyme E1 B
LGALVFDKDDDLAMDFVSAAANLRCHCFHIPLSNRFQNKGVAGNIIHAMATTNAISAGLVVLEAVKVLAGAGAGGEADKRGEEEGSKGASKEGGKGDRPVATWISRAAPRLLSTLVLDKPLPDCLVCNRSIKQLRLFVDTASFSLKRLFQAVCVGRLGLTAPSIDVSNRDNFVGSQEDQEESYLGRNLADPAVRIDNESSLTISDDFQDQTYAVVVYHRPGINEESNPDMFVLEFAREGAGAGVEGSATGSPAAATATGSPAAATATATAAAAESGTAAAGKRRRDEFEGPCGAEASAGGSGDELGGAGAPASKRRGPGL